MKKDFKQELIELINKHSLEKRNERYPGLYFSPSLR